MKIRSTTVKLVIRPLTVAAMPGLSASLLHNSVILYINTMTTLRCNRNHYFAGDFFLLAKYGKYLNYKELIWAYINI